LSFIETSALDGGNVEAAFQKILTGTLLVITFLFSKIRKRDVYPIFHWMDLT